MGAQAAISIQPPGVAKNDKAASSAIPCGSGRTRQRALGGADLGRGSTAVSRGLIDLENLAGLPLFQRGAAEMSLTDAGKALLAHARQVCVALLRSQPLHRRWPAEPGLAPRLSGGFLLPFNVPCDWDIQA
ncbi:LysR family transcriptional regulator [Achromobacter ruhlandii]|uniref:LysR family transcriptional regulator n=1 Tax=Achromobacter ruhlandii TaxID=72557 RepID=UPI003B9EB1BE